ncbi:MAG: efflux RND transporter periplasmic adaptor subunit [Syntrophaceae bacterium]
MFNFSIKRKKAACGLAVLIVTGGLLGLYYKGHDASGSKTEDIPFVRTTVVAPADANQEHVYSGEVRGRYESQLAFQVGGKIVRRDVELGSRVRQGQPLLQIDPQDIQQILNSQGAQVAATTSQLKLAERNLKRYRQLYKEDVISRAQMEKHESAYEVALATHQQALAQQAHGKNQLNYSTLHADKQGIVSAISAEVGQVVAPGQVVVSLVRDGEREIEINVPENRTDVLRGASSIKVAFWALPNCIVDGNIREVAPMADPVSRTYRVRVSLLKQPLEVKLGMTASVTLSSPREGGGIVMIPLAAIFQTGQTPCVWVVNEGIVRLRPIQTGAFGDGRIQALSGLKQGETIVTAGVHKLREGQKVKPASGEEK